MANHKSAKKRSRQIAKRNEVNKWKKTRVRTFTKRLREAIESKDKENAKTLLVQIQGLLAKLAKTSALKKPTAARYTSRLASQVSKL